MAPFVNNDSAKTQLMQDMDGDGQHDVILEKDENGDTFLHLVMPASAVNFLNGHDGNSLFDFQSDERAQQHQSYAGGAQAAEDVFVELGCKVYEVNKVYYRGNNKDNALMMHDTGAL